MRGSHHKGLFEDTDRGAVFSECGLYRYRLWRKWAAAGGTCTWVMLNPSTADALRDDPTIRRCIGFARSWGYGGIEVVNLFAYRATNPASLKLVPSPVTEPGDHKHKNFEFIALAMQRSSIAVAAWGRPASAHNISATFLQTMKERWPDRLRVLGFNQDGTPKHPLMVPGSVLPVMVVQ